MEEPSIFQGNSIILNFNLTMGEYVLNSPMVFIPMGGVDVVLGVQWLQSLGTMVFNFHTLFMKFSWKEKEFVLSGITGKSCAR